MGITLLKSCLVCFVVLCWFNVLMVSSTEFEVGGNDGWAIPKSGDYYNDWASQNRFVLHDTLRFKYDTDSVIEVNEEDYNKCKASRPLFFSNNGDTVFTFDRPGLFFFISGVSGHCDRGQKLVVKVLDAPAHSSSSSPPPQNGQNDDQSSPHSGAASSYKTTSAPNVVVVSSFILLFLA